MADDFEEEGESLIIEVKKYEPDVLRSDFLEQLNVPVFATLGVIRGEPISLPEIKSVRVEIVKQKQAQKENASVKGTSEEVIKNYLQGSPKFYKARPATLDNLGYLKIMLKKIEKESEVPEKIDIDLKATIKYEAELASFTIGGESLRELKQETEEEAKENKHEREILGGRAYIRISSIRGKTATIYIYDQNFEKSSSVTLDEEEISRSINVPGSDETQPERIRLKLEEVRNSGKIKLKLNGEEKSYDLREEILDEWEIANYHDDERTKNQNYIMLRNKDTKTWSWPILTGEESYDELSDLKELTESCSTVKDCKIYKDSQISILQEKKFNKETFLEAINSLEEMGLEQFIEIEENIKDKYALFEIAGRGDEGSKKYYPGDTIGDSNCNCKISSIYSNKVYVKGVKNCDSDERSDTKTFEVGTAEHICNQALSLKGITTKQEAVVRILPGTGKGESTTYFSLHIPVEKRAIQYTPEELQDKINRTQELIKKLDNTIKKLQGIVEAWTKICLATMAVFTVMAFFKGMSSSKETDGEDGSKESGGEATIRKEIMFPTGVTSFDQLSYGYNFNKRLSKSKYYFHDQGMYKEGDNSPIAYTYARFKFQPKGQTTPTYYRLNPEGELKEETKNFGKCGSGDNSGCREVRFSDDGSDISVGIRSCNQFNYEYRKKCEEAKAQWGNALTLVYYKQQKLMQVWWNGEDGKLYMNKNGENDGDRPVFEIPSNSGEFKSLERDLIKMRESNQRGESDHKWEGYTYNMGKKFASGSKSEDAQCSKVMSPGQCKILFNACDPVMCPASRCDFNDRYRVDNVIQSGLLGSLLLCLPNIKDGVMMPVCLSGILAALKNIKSILQGYVNCLQESLKNDQSVGICDRIRSVFICQILWREAMTLLGLAQGNLFDAAVAKGGGEYLGLKGGVDNAKKTVNYFTNDYAKSVFAAYRGKSSKELGAEICEKAIYGKTPILGDVLDEVTKAQNPPQFTAYIEEQPYSQITAQQSAYKLYYHIYAGSQTVNYNVYLKKNGRTYKCKDCSGTLQEEEFVDKSTAFFNEKGYNTICVSINGKESCNFGRVVSTSFAANAANDYVRQYFLSKKIETAEQCREDARGYLPKAQIEKVCSAMNPGIGKGTNEQKSWEKIGTCGTNKEGAFQGDCWAKMGNLEEDNPQAYQEVRGNLCENDGGKVCGLNEKCDGSLQITTVSGGYKSIRCCYGTCETDGTREELKSDLKSEEFVKEKDAYEEMYSVGLEKCEDEKIPKNNPFQSPPTSWGAFEKEIEDQGKDTEEYFELSYFKGMMYLLCKDCDKSQDQFNLLKDKSPNYYKKACGENLPSSIEPDKGGMMLKYCPKTACNGTIQEETTRPAKPTKKEEEEKEKEQQPVDLVSITFEDSSKNKYTFPTQEDPDNFPLEGGEYKVTEITFTKPVTYCSFEFGESYGTSTTLSSTKETCTLDSNQISITEDTATLTIRTQAEEDLYDYYEKDFTIKNKEKSAQEDQVLLCQNQAGTQEFCLSPIYHKDKRCSDISFNGQNYKYKYYYSDVNACAINCKTDCITKNHLYLTPDLANGNNLVIK